VAEKVEAEEGGRCVRAEAQCVGIDGVNGEEVTVRTVTGWRSRSDIPGVTGVVPEGDGGSRQSGAVRCACPRREFRYIDGDVGHGPMPESAAGRSIGIINSDGETLGP